MVKKKLLKRLAASVLSIAMFCTLSSFTDENENGGGNCDLCIIKENKKVLFSCKLAPNQNCSKEQEINDAEKGRIKVKVSCEGAVAC